VIFVRWICEGCVDFEFVSTVVEIEKKQNYFMQNENEWVVIAVQYSQIKILFLEIWCMSGKHEFFLVKHKFLFIFMRVDIFF
jgi:hypothetical protein